MYPENLKKNLNYKLRELELIIKQINSDNEFSDIDIDLAIEKARNIHDILLSFKAEIPEDPGGEKKPLPSGKPVVPSDPDPVKDDKIYEAEGIVPGPSQSMGMGDRHQGRPKEQESAKKPGEEPGEEAGRKSGKGSGKRSGKEAGMESREESGKKSGEEAGYDTGNQDTGGRNIKDQEATKEQEVKPWHREEKEAEHQPSSDQKGESEPDKEKETTPPAGPEASDKKPRSAGKNTNRPDNIEIVADKYQSSQNYINQAIAKKQTQKDLTSRIQYRSIADLRNSIGLNDKFLFIKEIFRGRPEKYNQCIDDINNSKSYEAALTLLRTKYSIDEKSEAVKKFLVLVKRKHQAE